MVASMPARVANSFRRRAISPGSRGDGFATPFFRIALNTGPVVSPAQFSDQHTHGFKHRVFTRDVAQAIREPLIADSQRAQSFRFLLSLRSFENYQVVNFAAWDIDTSDRRNQISRSDRANICAVLGMKIIDQPRVEPGHPVPNETLKISTHRMELVVPRRGLHGSTHITQ
jgi:hypothetical protein